MTPVGRQSGPSAIYSLYLAARQPLSASQSQRQRVLLTLDIAMAGQASQARPWCCTSQHPLPVGSHALSQGSPRSTLAQPTAAAEFSNQSSWSLFQAFREYLPGSGAVSKWPNQPIGWAAWPAPGAGAGRAVLALGREVTLTPEKFTFRKSFFAWVQSWLRH